MREDLSNKLSYLGFTDYEARVYLALLKQSPLTGYAISRVSGVPRSKVYEVLSSLVDRGDVLISYGEPIQYTPKPPAELIETRRLTIEKQLSDAEKGLEEFTNLKTPNDLIWDIRGCDEIFYRVNEVIGRANNQILMEIWEEDVNEIHEALETASNRGVSISIMAYGKPDLPFAQVYTHEPGAHEIEDQFGGRWIIVSIDGLEIVAGIVSLGKDSRAAWSSHLGIVMPIAEQIKHDLYISIILNKHRDILEASFGPELRNLRAKFGPPTSVFRP
ncbi:MAG: TrmB family transcriptional regulator [Anaerolineae bacterium]|nr:TrmB family transcriptional regulator [Anaerolineae bacterium]